MVKSATDDETRTAPLKPSPFKIIGMGSIPISDKDFLAWREQHCPRLATRDAMLMYMRDLNGQNKIRFEQEMEQWKRMYMRAKLSPEQRKELEDLTASRDELKAAVSEQKALYETLGQTIVLTPQNIPPLSEQSPP
jgi:hypothetical protein